MQRILLITGSILVLAGFLWPWLSNLPFGKLPGDIIIDKPDFKIYIPITTMIIVSLFISLIIWLFKK